MMDVSENTTSTQTVATGSSSASNYESTAAAAKDFEDALNDVSKFQNKLPTFELADGWRIDVKQAHGKQAKFYFSPDGDERSFYDAYIASINEKAQVVESRDDRRKYGFC